MAKTYLISRTCVFTVYIDQEIDAESEEEALEKFEEMENHGDFDHERIEDIVNGWVLPEITDTTIDEMAV